MSIRHSTAPALPGLGLLERVSLTLPMSYHCFLVSCPNPCSPPTESLPPVVRVALVDVRQALSRASQHPELLAPAIVGHHSLIGLLFSVDWDQVLSASPSRLDVCVHVLVLQHLHDRPWMGVSLVVTTLTCLRRTGYPPSCLLMHACFVVSALK